MATNELEHSDVPLFDQFLFALLYLTDERGKAEPNSTVVDSWYKQAQILFARAVRKAVKVELEAVELEVVVK